jgi:hypothetical protein
MCSLERHNEFYTIFCCERKKKIREIKLIRKRENVYKTLEIIIIIIIINCKWVFTRWQWYNNKTTDK